jgi:hypothetical protein
VGSQELLGVEEFDREFSPEQRMLLGVVEQLGLEPHEAAARLVDASADEARDERSVASKR